VTLTFDKTSSQQVFDGWELEGELFPAIEDHPLTLAERYNMFCGASSPSKVFFSSQNVALVLFHIPGIGEGFTVKVTFHQHPQRKFVLFFDRCFRTIFLHFFHFSHSMFVNTFPLPFINLFMLSFVLIHKLTYSFIQYASINLFIHVFI